MRAAFFFFFNLLSQPTFPPYSTPPSQASTPSTSASARGRPSAQTPSLAAKQAAITARATGQAKSIGFLAFMMWMSGGGVHLFSLMMTASGLYQPLMAIVKSGDGEREVGWEMGCVSER